MIPKHQISPYDNVLYFPNNIDVRICPKNGMTTLKSALRKIYGMEHMGHVTGNYNYRYRRVTEEADGFNLPFRKNSFKIAIRRDPIDRFKSACEFIQKERSFFIRNGRPEDLPEISQKLEEVIEAVKNQTIKNNHFFTQTWYLGEKSQYDMIYHIDEMPKLLAFIGETCGVDNEVDFVKIHENKTNLKLYNEALTDEVINDLKELYKKDYLNWWCKQDEFSC